MSTFVPVTVCRVCESENCQVVEDFNNTIAGGLDVGILCESCGADTRYYFQSSVLVAGVLQWLFSFIEEGGIDRMATAGLPKLRIVPSVHNGGNHGQKDQDKN